MLSLGFLGPLFLVPEPLADTGKCHVELLGDIDLLFDAPVLVLCVKFFKSLLEEAFLRNARLGSPLLALLFFESEERGHSLLDLRVDRVDNRWLSNFLRFLVDQLVLLLLHLGLGLLGALFGHLGLARFGWGLFNFLCDHALAVINLFLFNFVRKYLHGNLSRSFAGSGRYLLGPRDDLGQNWQPCVAAEALEL